MIATDKYKLIIFDRDGVLNKEIKRGDVISSPRSLQEFEFCDDIKFINKNSKKYFGLSTNQPDIKRGYVSIDIVNKINTHVCEKVGIDKIAMCPHDDYDNCSCRKPKSGMLIDLMKHFKVTKNQTLFIGDNNKDFLAAKNANIDFILKLKPYNKYLLKQNNIIYFESFGEINWN